MQQPIKINPRGIVMADALNTLFLESKQQHIKDKYRIVIGFESGESPNINLGEPYTIRVNGIEINAIFEGWDNDNAVLTAYIEPERIAALREMNG